MGSVTWPTLQSQLEAPVVAACPEIPQGGHIRSSAGRAEAGIGSASICGGQPPRIEPEDIVGEITRLAACIGRGGTIIEEVQGIQGLDCQEEFTEYAEAESAPLGKGALPSDEVKTWWSLH